MKDIVPFDSEKNDAFTKILRFMTDADIVLSAEEEKILDRWIYCDVLLRQRKFKEEDIIDKIKDKFSVSKFTARNDIYKAQALFEGARKVSKTYLLHHHIEDIALHIERIKFDKSLSHLLPKLYDSYTKAVLALPDETNKNVLPPPVFMFNVVQGQEIKKPMSFEEARAAAQKKLNRSEKDYTDFEDQPYENE